MKKILFVVIILNCFVATSFAAVLSIGKKTYTTPILKEASSDGFKETVQLGLEFSFNWKIATVIISPRLGTGSAEKTLSYTYVIQYVTQYAIQDVEVDYTITVPETISYTEIDYGLRFHKLLLGFLDTSVSFGGTATTFRYNTVENLRLEPGEIKIDRNSANVNLYSYWYSYGVRFHTKSVLIGLEMRTNLAPEVELLDRTVDLDSQEINLFFDIGF